MLTRREIAAFRAVQAGLSDRARNALAGVWAGLDPEDRAELFRVVPSASADVIAVLSEVSGVYGADFYDEARAQVSGLPSFAAPTPAATPSEQILASTRWALVQPDPLGNLMKVADRLTKAPGRIAIEQAIAADPANPRFARIPQGPTTCRFCAMLASRGAVYLSEETADGHDFHDHCDCEAVPIFGEDLPEGYDPDHYFEIYRSEGGASIDLGGDRSAVVPTAA
jgi:hypothetical protein